MRECGPWRALVEFRAWQPLSRYQLYNGLDSHYRMDSQDPQTSESPGWWSRSHQAVN